MRTIGLVKILAGAVVKLYYGLKSITLRLKK